MKNCKTSKDIIDFASRIINFRRHAITEDSKKTVKVIQEYINLKLIKIASNTKCWDWVIPKKWTLKKAEIKFKGKTIFNDKEHVMAIQPYCSPFKGEVELKELLSHITYNKKMPKDYSYNCSLAYRYPYQKNWLISIPYNRVQKLKKGKYEVSIDCKFSDDEMLIGEHTIKGKTNKIIILLSDMCHPGQADDGIIGIGLWIRIIQNLSKRKNLRYTYKFYTPTETIGTIAWLWKRKTLIPKIKAGIFLESIGNKQPLKVKLSHKNTSEIDKISKQVFNKNSQYNFSEGVMNDELIYADSDFDIPMISLQRFPYPEYHTSSDNINAISEKSLEESYNKTIEIIEILEANYFPKKTVTGPIYLTKHNLYKEASNKQKYWLNWNLMNLLGKNMSILQISEELNINFWEAYNTVELYRKVGLVIKTYK